MNKFNLIILLFLVSTTILFSQVDLEITDGMLVETTGGVYISGASDIVENGTGYLKGVVESYSLSGATQFAGLIFSSGFTGTITRTTGSELSSSAPKTILRSYELVSSSVIALDVNAEIVISGTNDESNGIVDKYIYTKNGSIWEGYSDNGSTADNITAAGVDIPSGTSNITVAEGIGVGAKLYLEGPYTSSAKSTTISGSIPTLSPYSEAVRTVSSIPANVVDWVLVQLRDQITPSTVVASRAAFLNNDGYIIDDAGNNGIGLPGIPGSYYISIKHRNHLSVMSSSAQTLGWISP